MLTRMEDNRFSASRLRSSVAPRTEDNCAGSKGGTRPPRSTAQTHGWDRQVAALERMQIALEE